MATRKPLKTWRRNDKEETMGKLTIAPRSAGGEAETLKPASRICNIFDWSLMDEKRPDHLARGVLAATTLTHLMVAALEQGGDELGLAEDSASEELLLHSARFSSHLASILVDRLSDGAA